MSQYTVSHIKVIRLGLKVKLLKLLLKVKYVWNIGIKIMTGNEKGNFIGDIGLKMVIINIHLAAFRTDSSF